MAGRIDKRFCLDQCRAMAHNLCYDYGYLLLPEEKVLIVNWQPYMEGK